MNDNIPTPLPDREPDLSLTPISTGMEVATSSSEIEVRLCTNSANGDDRIITTISGAVTRLKEEVEKFGKWIYVGKKRFRLDPKSAASVESLKQELTRTPTARVTGSLRGGSTETMTLKELKKAAKEAGIPRSSKFNKAQLIAALDSSKTALAPVKPKTKKEKKSKRADVQAAPPPREEVQTLTMPPKPLVQGTPVDLVHKDSQFTRLETGQEFVLVVVRDGNELRSFTGANFKALRNEVASIVLSEIQG
jgi:hypothetical protein